MDITDVEFQAGMPAWRGRTRISILHREFSLSLLYASIVAFALLFSVGDFKNGLDASTLDLTAVVAVLVFALSMLSFLGGGGKIQSQVVWMVALFVSISLAVVYTEWSSYAVDKTVRLFSLGLLAAVLPSVILVDLASIRRFMSWLTIFGLLIAFGGLLQVINGTTVEGRASGFSSSTISLGRNAGIALVVLYANVLARKGHRWLMALLCIPLFVVLVSSGSRGPLLFAVAVLAFLTVRWSLGSLRSIVIAAALLVTVAMLLTQVWSFLPKQSVSRIDSLLEQRYDGSAAERGVAFNVAFHESLNHPLGLGLGGFSRVYTFGNSADRVYPHNMVLELAVENGWPVAFFFVFLIVLAVVRSYRAAVKTPDLRSFFGVLLFALGNSLVSGDLSDNKIVFALIAVALQLPDVLTANENLVRFLEHS